MQSFDGGGRQPIRVCVSPEVLAVIPVQARRGTDPYESRAVL